MKKLLSLILVIACMGMSTSAVVYADNQSIYDEFIRMQNDREPVADIMEYYEEYEEVLSAYTCDEEQLQRDAVATERDPEPVIGEIPAGRVARSGGGEDEDNSMTAEQWDAIEEQATKGNILITKDDNTPAITHGHAAMVYVNCSKTVEILGPGYVPQEYNISRWGDYEKVKLIYPDAVDFDVRKSAADEAYSTFVDIEEDEDGWSYYFLPNVNNASEVNCATLVWRSYNAVGLTLGKFGNSSIPESLLTGAGDIICKVSANWSCDTNW